MANVQSDEELKRRILQLLREDEEFRFAVAGLIGLDSILSELRRLREDFSKRFEAIERKLLEHDRRFEAIEKILLEYGRKLESHDKRFEAIERKLLEHDKRFEAIERKLLEHDKRFEAIERKLLEHDKRFEAIERKLLEHDRRFEAIEKKLLEHDKRFEAIEAKLYEHDGKFNELNRRLSNVELVVGALAESVYSKFVWDDLLEEIRASGERVVMRRRNARVDGEDIDLLIVTDRSVYVVEVKVKPKVADVGALLAKSEVVARHYPGRRVAPVLAGALVGREVEGYAEGKGVRVYIY